MNTKDPRKIKSYPSSPRTHNIAAKKWEYNADEANISWADEEPHSKLQLSPQRSIRKLNSKIILIT